MIRQTVVDYLCFKSIDGQKLAVNFKESQCCFEVTLKKQEKNVFPLLLTSLLLLVSLYIKNLPHVSVLFGLVLLYVCNKLLSYHEETLLLVKGLGYQITKKGFLRNSTMFAPYQTVQEVFINEVIFRLKVVPVINLMQKDAEEPKLVPLFKDFLPRLDCLELIYRKMIECNSRSCN